MTMLRDSKNRIWNIRIEPGDGSRFTQSAVRFFAANRKDVDEKLAARLCWSAVMRGFEGLHGFGVWLAFEYLRDAADLRGIDHDDLFDSLIGVPEAACDAIVGAIKEAWVKATPGD